MTTWTAVVLAGGRSSRMGRPKADLPWHGSTLLRRTVGVLQRSADAPVVVVRAPGQALPELPPGVTVVDDPVEGRGPLQGMAVGLSAAAADAAFVCSTDLPFLHPAWVRCVQSALAADVDAVLPHARGFRQPLAAAYRTALAADCAELVAADQLKPAFLLQRCRTARLYEEHLRADAGLAAHDPDLDSVAGVNDPDDYAAALARPLPEVVVSRFGVLARAGGRGPVTVRAATLGAACDAVGLALDRHVVAAVNGDQLGRDRTSPLVAGDRVALLSADAGG